MGDDRNGQAILFQDVHRSFDDNKVLNGLSLEIPWRKVTTILGGRAALKRAGDQPRAAAPKLRPMARIMPKKVQKSRAMAVPAPKSASILPFQGKGPVNGVVLLKALNVSAPVVGPRRRA